MNETTTVLKPEGNESLLQSVVVHDNPDVYLKGNMQSSSLYSLWLII